MNQFKCMLILIMLLISNCVDCDQTGDDLILAPNEMERNQLFDNDNDGLHRYKRDIINRIRKGTRTNSKHRNFD